MLYEVLPDPRAVQVLHIHRTIPDTVQIGHFGRGGVDFGEFDASVLDHARDPSPLESTGWSSLVTRKQSIDLAPLADAGSLVRFDFLA